MEKKNYTLKLVNKCLIALAVWSFIVLESAFISAFSPGNNLTWFFGNMCFDFMVLGFIAAIYYGYKKYMSYQNNETALAILKRRRENGELTEKQYKGMRKVILEW